MTMGIIHALLRLLLGVFTPGTGRRRAGKHLTTRASTRHRGIPHPPGTPARQGLGELFGPAWGWTARPRPPYGLLENLDGCAPAVAYEQREAQARRRLALVLAADFGIDLDTRVLHGAGVPR
ncbi:hypothetical protein I3F58_13245 [Streptomyces sp. MUM 203J]|uniref:hypothetical protein n=1 Tax=Streptomyces sp. MUM 203J TaxID=2791990 RepID=UPI001F0443B8|nr:hypothetical protein [Streptomyces sp. MUM 203J]MCH0540520.1 hypothetical protein [Streptomyces sp. MUM 203J]